MELRCPSFHVLFTFLLRMIMVLKIGKRGRTKDSTLNLFPGPWKLPFIGNLHQLIGFLPHHGPRDLAQKYGPLMHPRLGEISTIVVSSPEFAKEVMKTHDIASALRPHILDTRILSYGSTSIAFAPYGDYWRQLRKICIIELLSTKHFRSYQPIREEEDIFGGGSETSATAVDWAMPEMIKNPRIMKMAQEEVREVFNRKGQVDETCIREMKYLNLVIKETLRLHPSVPMLLPRECRERCEIAGYEIPVKTQVIVNAWAIGRDSNYWTDPESFYPERFLDSSVDYKGTNFEYIPFGAGRRICPGISYGLANIELPLALLLYHFDWELPNGMNHEALDMTEASGVTICRKEDLQLIPIPYHPPVY